MSKIRESMLITLLASKKDILQDNLSDQAIFRRVKSIFRQIQSVLAAGVKDVSKLSSVSLLFSLRTKVVCVVWYNLRINKVLKTPSLYNLTRWTQLFFINVFISGFTRFNFAAYSAIRYFSLITSRKWVSWVNDRAERSYQPLKCKGTLLTFLMSSASRLISWSKKVYHTLNVTRV